MNPLSFPRKRESCKKTQVPAKAGQAAIELAIFGAILIFILGTIVRSAVGNGYAQNENFKAMRMAMLASWQGTGLATGKGALANTSHNGASVLFIEDRLSPDFNKYGDVDRNPFIAQGSGTFSYNLFYPWEPGVDPVGNLIPIMDIWINGQHFPFTTASYVTKTITRPTSCPYAANSCLQNQCLRNQREWAGGTINENQFETVVPVTILDAQTDATMAANAHAIFNELANEGLISLIGAQGATVNSSTLPSAFIAWLEATFPGTGQAQVNQIQSILQSNQTQYKLFYTMVVNGTKGTPPFSPTPPQSCSGKDNALCSTLTMLDANGNSYTNTNGDMQYDLFRTGNYTLVDSQFPPVSSCSDVGVTPDMRCYVAWQWAATPGTTAASIGLNTASNEYPNYDIDGRLKNVTIYAISQSSGGAPTVTYEDYQGGDIDGAWDFNSCGPKPGLQNNSQIFTFTKEGTYLQIKEGKLYNPETGQFVRSANQRDTADLIQRTIQLSNNTGDFCNGATPQPSVNGSSPNPVEVCIPPGSGDNCFSSEQNIKSTCFDENDNMIFVRSRLQDRRGHFWMTDTSGQLKVQ